MSGVPAGKTGVVTVNLKAIERNWKALARVVAPAVCGGVVKADAYGLGANRVIPALSRAGCRTFFVATADEAVQARTLSAGATIFVLDGLVSGSEAVLIGADAIPVLSDPDAIREWADIAAGRNTRLPLAIQVDSGLNRLGLTEDGIHSLSGEEAVWHNLDLRLVMSHLACADEPNNPMNECQLQAFQHLSSLLPAGPRSLAASDGLMLGKGYHCDLVRPGYALYGGQAFQGGRTPVEPAVRADAVVLQVRNVDAGQSIGYSATFHTAEPRRIATIAAGYADGMFRSLSAGDGERGGSVVINGKRAPIVGRVSMDLITVDVSADPFSGLKRGDWVTLIGPDLPVELVGSSAKTIGYEVLTNLGRRFARVYLDGEQD